MFTETTLHKCPELIRAFTGIPAEEFWDILEKMEAKLPAHEMGRHTRDDRKRAVGAGRKFDQSLAQRTVAVLSYLRLHAPQLVIALMFGLTQCDISRDLRRLLILFYLAQRYGMSRKIIKNRKCWLPCHSSNSPMVVC